ncbi:hypothetical protein BH10PLA2_BH10PLA2_11090 [soil metagenome]
MVLPKQKSPGSRVHSARCRLRANRLQVELLENRLVPTTFTVLNANDSGPNSLREVILKANADLSPETDIIRFNIPASGVQTITLEEASGPLPAITDSVTIDGSSQPGFAGTPLIVLNGSNLSSGNGLVINAADSTIKSLAIGHFTNGSGIVIGGVESTGVTRNLVVGCYLGLAADGTTAAANDVGIRIDNGGSANTVGGPTEAGRNVISGNTEFGIAIAGAAATNVVAGNYIGLDATGLAALPNGGVGIILSRGAHNNFIGGSRNMISGNGSHGILLKDPATRENIIDFNVIGANVSPLDQIGIDVSEKLSLGNGGDGIHIEFSPDNRIGDTQMGFGTFGSNIIAFNAGAGIAVGDEVGGFAAGNLIQQNWIFGNGKLGINSAPGTLAHFPRLTSAVYRYAPSAKFGSQTVKLTGTMTGAANTSYRIEFFSTQTPDASGFGQGQTFLWFTTVLTNASGTGDFEKTLEGFYYKPEWISATATGPDNTTSRFSQNISVLEHSEFYLTQPYVYVSSAAGAVTIYIERQAGNDGEFQVDYTTLADRAVAGTDFLPVSGTLKFAPGEILKSITITVLDNPAATQD